MKQWFKKIKKYNWTFLVVWTTILLVSYLLWSAIFNLVKAAYE